jgi:hypothetical protein
MNVMHNTFETFESNIQARVPHKSNEKEVRFYGFRVCCLVSHPHPSPLPTIALTMQTVNLSTIAPPYNHLDLHISFSLKTKSKISICLSDLFSS